MNGRPMLRRLSLSLRLALAFTLLLGWLAVVLPARAAARLSPAEELLVG